MSLDQSRVATVARPSTDADDFASGCREVLGSLWDYLDGGCAPALADRLDAHFERCGTCARLRDLQSRFLASLAALRSRSPAPARLHYRVRRLLAAERRPYRPG